MWDRHLTYFEEERHQGSGGKRYEVYVGLKLGESKRGGVITGVHWVGNMHSP